jgi:hypothetical protein
MRHWARPLRAARGRWQSSAGVAPHWTRRPQAARASCRYLGAADATLGAVTSSGAAVLTIVGAGAATLGDVATSGQGELGLEVGAGAGNVTLGATTGTATAMLLIVRGRGVNTGRGDNRRGRGATRCRNRRGHARGDHHERRGPGVYRRQWRGDTGRGNDRGAALLLPIGAGGDVATGDIVSTASGKLAIVGAAAVTLDTITGAAAGLLDSDRCRLGDA